MFRILISLAFLLITVDRATAQIQVSSLQKSRDYLNCKLSYFAILEKVNAETSLKSKFDSIKTDLEKVKIETAINYDGLYKLLNNRFSRTLQIFSKPLNDLDIQQLAGLNQNEASKKLVDTAFEILKAAYSAEYERITPQKDILLTNVSNYLSVNTKTSEDLNPIGSETSSDSSKNDDEEKEMRNPPRKISFFSSNNFNFWTLLPLILSIFALIVLMKNVIQLNERIERRKRDLNLLKDTYDFNSQKSTGTAIFNLDIDKKISGSDKISNIEQSIISLQTRISKLESTSTGLPYKQEPLVEVSKQKESEANVFYMSSPSNNYFPNTAKSLTKENTVYKFIVSSNKTEAIFEIHSMGGVPVSEIAKRRESYIKPGCDEENVPPPITKNIITKKQGTARLEGDKWIIINKALIRYE